MYRLNMFGMFRKLKKVIGVWAGGATAPSKFGQLRFFGSQEKFGQSQFLKKSVRVCVRVVFFRRAIFRILT